MSTQRIMLWHNNSKICAELSPTSTKIIDSYKICSKSDMRSILKQLRLESYGKAIHLISLSKMVKEWRAHNLLYDLGLFRSHTKDVDLNLDESKWHRLGYSVLSLFYCPILRHKDEHFI